MFAGTFVGEDMSYSLGLDDVFEGDVGLHNVVGNTIFV
jgi:hypothetical protein